MILVSGCSETTNKGGDYYDDVDVVMAVMVVIGWFLIVQVGKFLHQRTKQIMEKFSSPRRLRALKIITEVVVYAGTCSWKWRSRP